MADYMIANEVLNPYAVGPAQGMQDIQRHESGNAIAAEGEARAIASIKAQVIMAKQFPRDPELAMERILNECKRATLAEQAVYSFPRGKEMVTGPSIRLAEMLARNFGNITFGYEELERRPAQGGKPGSSVIRAYAWDFETNMVVERKFEVRHWRNLKNGNGYAITDERDIYEYVANMASRRIRACILQIIPGDVTDAAVAACKYTAGNKISVMMANPQQRGVVVAKMVKLYEGMGVTLDDLETYLACKSEDWTADHMLKLKEIKNALDDNTTTLGDLFPRLAVDNKDEVVTKEQVKALMEAAKATGYQGKVTAELKKMGIAKFADVPVKRYEEVMQMIQGFGLPVEEEKKELPVGEGAEQMKV